MVTLLLLLPLITPQYWWRRLVLRLPDGTIRRSYRSQHRLTTGCVNNLLAALPPPVAEVLSLYRKSGDFWKESCLWSMAFILRYNYTPGTQVDFEFWPEGWFERMVVIQEKFRPLLLPLWWEVEDDSEGGISNPFFYMGEGKVLKQPVGLDRTLASSPRLRAAFFKYRWGNRRIVPVCES